LFEGSTLLGEAMASGVAIAELYATQTAYDAEPLVRRAEEAGIPTFIVEAASAAAISDLTTPSGIVAVAPIRADALGELFGRASPVLALADVSDPANAGSLVRSADAFGCSAIVFGSLGVDPYHPKVVRGSMGAIFRVRIAIADPSEIERAAGAAGFTILGLAADGEPLAGVRWDAPTAIVVGNERVGLGRWAPLCRRIVAIPMVGPSESLSAAVAGSIALYEASLRRSAS
ncbi:MAG: RNA methyltransferase, partial [Candidatus Baltobacteraceae bacterium]